jgi:hypothetical protein
MIDFLHNSVIIKTGDATTERDVSNIEVFGQIKSIVEIEMKIVELAKEKHKETAVVIILPTITDCERLSL